jgi:transposase
MPYQIAGIDVHKEMLAVVVADVEIDGDFHFKRQKVGTTPADLRRLADWLVEHEVEEVVMESTAQYWRPVWEALEQHWRPRRARDSAPKRAGTLHLAQAQSNRGPGGRKKDFPDAERLVKRLVAQELTLSFAPDVEQRLWRTVMRRKYQVTRNRVQLHNRLEALLEEAHIKVSSIVSDLLGISARRMLQALADGETDPAALATLAAPRLRATPEQLCDAFQACRTLHPVYRRLLKLTLEELRVIEDHLGQLDQQMADLLAAHHDAVQRLAEVPGLVVDSAQQIIAEVGATAATFSPPQAPCLLDGRLPRQRGECGRDLQPPVSQRQSPDAARPQSGCQCRGQGQGDNLRRRLPPNRPTPRPCSGDRGHHPPAMPSDLDNSSPAHPRRRTRASREHRGEEGTRAQDDP